MSHSQFHSIICLHLDMHGLVFKTSIWLLAGSTRLLWFEIEASGGWSEFWWSEWSSSGLFSVVYSGVTWVAHFQFDQVKNTTKTDHQLPFTRLTSPLFFPSKPISTGLWVIEIPHLQLPTFLTSSWLWRPVQTDFLPTLQYIGCPDTPPSHLFEFHKQQPPLSQWLEKPIKSPIKTDHTFCTFECALRVGGFHKHKKETRWLRWLQNAKSDSRTLIHLSSRPAISQAIMVLSPSCDLLHREQSPHQIQRPLIVCFAGSKARTRSTSTTLEWLFRMKEAARQPSNQWWMTVHEHQQFVFADPPNWNFHSLEGKQHPMQFKLTMKR